MYCRVRLHTANLAWAVQTCRYLNSMGMCLRRARCLLALMFCAACHAGSAELSTARIVSSDAAEAELLKKYAVTSWSTKEGAPKIVYAIAQTNDGWLWFAGPDGLYRFDGVQFKHIELDLPNSNVSQASVALLATRNGRLLIGGFRGGISILERGQVTRFRDANNIGTSVFCFAEGSDGVLWAGTRTGLVRFDGRSWKRLTPEWKLPEVAVKSLLVDRQGTTWVATESQIFRLLPGGTRFEATTFHIGINNDLTETADGRAWAVDTLDARLLPHQSSSPKSHSWNNSSTSHISLFDQSDNLWSIYSKQPLLSDATTIIEDGAGDIWLGTLAGKVVRLHRKPMALPFPNEPSTGAPYSLFAADDRDVIWVARAAEDLDGGNLWRYDSKLSKVSYPGLVSAVTRAPDGTLWASGKSGLWHQVRGKFTLVTRLPIEIGKVQVGAMAVGPRGDPWVALHGKGLLHFVEGRWLKKGGYSALPDIEPEVLAFDRSGCLWLGYGDGSLMVIDGERVRIVATADTLNLGALTAFSFQPHFLVAGDRGISILKRDQFVRLRVDDASAIKAVGGIVEKPSGETWLNGAEGLVFIPPGQLDGSVVQGALSVSTERFDSNDGYPGQGLFLAPTPTMTEMPNGDIWFCGDQGVAWLNPAHIVHRASLPPPFIDDLLVDGQSVAFVGESKIREGAANLQVNYTALDYAHPDRLKFRYRLSGFDKNWVEVGTRRQAFYTNLPSGRYQFEVEAASESGPWSVRPATIRFEIPPTFIQTPLFLALCTAVSALLLAFLHRLRMRQFAARERMRLEERLNERLRIARELHDTLLQGTQALIFSVHAASGREDEEGRRHDLAVALRDANAVLADGRDRIQGLRAGSSTELPESIAIEGEAVTALTGIAVDIAVTGPRRPLVEAVRDEAFSICREAILNASRHSGATQINVEIRYGTRFVVSVRDSGRGIDVDAMTAAEKSGHWGLRGMRERSEAMGGSLEIKSVIGTGTHVELNMPSSLAYRRGSFANFRLKLWRRRRLLG